MPANKMVEGALTHAPGNGRPQNQRKPISRSPLMWMARASLMSLRGLGFLDHMLESFSKHSMMDLKIRATGDLHIDMHHTTEDTGIVIGQALAKALGDLKGIRRFGSAEIPMDETCSKSAVDISADPTWSGKWRFLSPNWVTWIQNCLKNGSRPFAQNAGITLHVETLYGENNHHIVESAYKATARALRQAVRGGSAS